MPTRVICVTCNSDKFKDFGELISHLESKHNIFLGPNGNVSEYDTHRHNWMPHEDDPNDNEFYYAYTCWEWSTKGVTWQYITKDGPNKKYRGPFIE